MTIQRNVMTALIGMGLIASLEYASIAQSPTPTPSPTTPTNSGVRSSLSEFDRQFMVEAAQGGMAEVEFGKIAKEKAISNIVKEYARRMVVEHTQANNKLKALAQQKGVTLPTTIDKKNQDLKQDLSELSGAKLDREYMEEAGVKSHEEQAKLFDRQVQRGQDPEVKSFAAQTLPVVQKHLQHAQEIAVNLSTSSNRRAIAF